MDRAILLERLAQAERHVAGGVQQIARQRTVIANLERHGHDTNQARGLLAEFQSTQACTSPIATGSRKNLRHRNGAAAVALALPIRCAIGPAAWRCSKQSGVW